MSAQPAKERFLVNVASDEYWAVIKRQVGALGAPVYTIKFPGPSVFAKQARGLFCRFMSETKVKTPDELKRKFL